MKTPRYFCEHCGAEVKANARICPKCGRFFSAVKCPKCGFVGESEDFRAGCPVCGYALGSNNGAPEPIRPAPESTSLPLWAWALGFVVFIIALVLLLRAIK
ncbi:MAG: zinc ribbon domain-containing protein [Treponema sp.]|nr:zinc ribbon domain-containing protein [Treponema sp.]